MKKALFALALSLAAGAAHADGVLSYMANNAGGQIQLMTEPCRLANGQGWLAARNIVPGGLDWDGCWYTDTNGTVRVGWSTPSAGMRFASYAIRDFTLTSYGRQQLQQAMNQ
jgi:hypothetical protein